jgi:hypothetical protein
LTKGLVKSNPTFTKSNPRFVIRSVCRNKNCNSHDEFTPLIHSEKQVELVHGRNKIPIGAGGSRGHRKAGTRADLKHRLKHLIYPVRIELSEINPREKSFSFTKMDVCLMHNFYSDTHGPYHESRIGFSNYGIGFNKSQKKAQKPKSQKPSHIAKG